MSDLSAFLNEQMNNPEFAQEYNAVQPEMDAIRSMIKARKSQNLTQKQLAELVGIDQGDISKLGKWAAEPYHSAAKANCRQHEYDLKN